MMKLIFLTAFLYLFWEFMNRASVKTNENMKPEKVPGLIEFIKDMTSTLNKPLEKGVVEVEPLIDEQETDTRKVVSKEALIEVDTEKQTSPDDVLQKENPLDVLTEKQTSPDDVLQKENPLDEMPSSSAPVSSIDIKEWTRRNQQKKKKKKI